MPLGSEQMAAGEMLGLGNLKYKKSPKLSPVTLDRNKKIPAYIENSPAPEINQGTIGSCVCCTLVSIVIDEKIEQTKNNNFWIDWKLVWNEMKDLQIADDKQGSFLENALWYFQEYGFTAIDGTVIFPKNIQKVDPKDVDIYLANRYEIMTGCAIASPMTDKNWFLRLVKDTVGGHCWKIIGKMANSNRIDETSWDDYGYKDEGQFFHLKIQDKLLFSMYVIEI